MVNQSIAPLPPFIMSSVPKSGTHLMHQILNGLPNVKNDIGDAEKKFFIDHHVQDINILKDHFYRLAHLQPNEFGLGHMFYSEKYAYILERLKLKHIFVYRDPRDVLISLAYFIPAKWNEHPLFYDFHSHLTNHKDRIMSLLKGVDGKWPNFDAWNRPFYQWILVPNTLTLSFEELMLSQETRQAALTRIVNYLWDGQQLPEPLETIVEKMAGKIDPGKSNTFRKGKVGTWREEFDEEMKQTFKQVAGNLLIDFGYEKDLEW
ncbi:sulfotransferase domain-containing protein [Bacillus sp. BRMEA1]|uniref:sulfotransferase domain-containing protein n=1 Tax=Neobacillus endophyticus TaxID=2738405 RepID=UPI001566D174|nr:sulfotransferase domain-containing protein [Neobacillus endophyticus]NRD76718.1 sulfotransferase domain-containing protein [Neobacillus endophyticus]